MTIENRKRIITLKLRTRIIAFFMVLSIVLALIPIIPEILFLNINKTNLAIYISSFFVIHVIYRYNMELNYIYYSDDGDKIIFRYYSLRPFNDLKSSIEIKKKEFAKIEIQKFFFKQKEKITLFQKTKGGIAKYPSISISSLTKTDQILLKESLAKYSLV